MGQWFGSVRQITINVFISSVTQFCQHVLLMQESFFQMFYWQRRVQDFWSGTDLTLRGSRNNFNKSRIARDNSFPSKNYKQTKERAKFPIISKERLALASAPVPPAHRGRNILFQISSGAYLRGRGISPLIWFIRSICPIAHNASRLYTFLLIDKFSILSI